MKDFCHQTPYFRIFLALVAGIILFEFFKQEYTYIFFITLSSACFLFYFLVEKKNNATQHFKLRWLFGCGVFLFFMGVGFFISQNYESKSRFVDAGKKGVFEAEVTAVPVEKEKSMLITVSALRFADDSVHFRSSSGNAVLYLAKTEKARNLRVGDKILVASTFNTPKPNTNPEGFDYGVYLYRKGLRATAYADSLHWQKTYTNTGFSILQLASDFRAKLLSIYKKQGIEGDEFAVLGALTLGYTDEISSELYVSYSNSGALHILSVSGMHVGIVYVIFAFLLSFLDKSAKTRLLKSLIIIALLWSYAMLTGLSSSVMRAALMFSIVAFGEIFSYKSKIYNSIFFSAFLLLLINPNYIFDVSFQLSYMAVLGIVFFQPKIKQLAFFKNKIAVWSWDLFCVSIAAQIVTFPLGLFYFHKFSNHFLLTNFIAIPISTAIIYLSVLLFIVSPFDMVANWVGFVLKWLLKAQNASIVFVDHLPYSVFHTWISGLDVLMLFVMIVCFTIFISKKKHSALLIAFGCLLCISSVNLVRHITSKQRTEFIVYQDNKSTTIDFISPNKHKFFTTDSARGKMLGETFWLKEDYPMPEFLNKSTDYFCFEGKRFCIITDNSFRYKKSNNRLSIDYLIIGGKSKVSPTDIENLFETQNIIIDGTISPYYADKISLFCQEKKIFCHSINTKGAFLTRFSN